MKILVGLAFIALGLVFVFITAKGLSYNKKCTYFFGACLGIMGFLLILFEQINCDTGIHYTIAIGFGLFFIGTGLYNIINVFRCREKVQGKYVGAAVYKGQKSPATYAPIFSYTYKKDKISSQTPQTWSKRYIQKHFCKGKKYTIYVCPEKSYLFIVQRRIRIGDIGMLFLGALVIATIWS